MEEPQKSCGASVAFRSADARWFFQDLRSFNRVAKTHQASALSIELVQSSGTQNHQPDFHGYG
jgi:hypothetical protein